MAAGARRWGRAREAGRGVAWFGDPRGSFYRARGGHWRGGRREEGAPSMVAGTGADGASGKGNYETDVSKGGERNWRRFGSTSRCTGAARDGE
jgi:hypothetical protein